MVKVGNEAARALIRKVIKNREPCSTAETRKPFTKKTASLQQSFNLAFIALSGLW